jgi:hypothetical protein
MKNPTIQEMVAAYLTGHGFDGLYSDSECACLVSDLFPCGEVFSDCIAGYKGPCSGADCGADGDCDFHVGPTPAKDGEE